jgi:guanylate kinase
MISRGQDAPEVVERRIKNAEQEIAQRNHFDHCIVSGTKESDFLALQAIYVREKQARM